MSDNGTPPPVNIPVHASLGPLSFSVKVEVVKPPPPKPPWHKRISEPLDWVRRLEWLFDKAQTLADWMGCMVRLASNPRRANHPT